MTLDISGGVIHTTKAVLYGGAETFLLVRESDGTWGLPGGAKEIEDADILATLERELFEELSLEREDYTVVNPRISDEFVFGNPASERFGITGINNFFIVGIKDASKIRKEPEMMEVGWFGAEESLGKLEHDSMKRGFAKVMKLLKKS